MLKHSFFLDRPGQKTLAGTPEGLDALAIGQLVGEKKTTGAVHLHVARDEARMVQLAEALGFFAEEVTVLQFPAWDCLPYDRVSPIPEVSAKRIEVLSVLAQGVAGPCVVLTTVAAILQRVPTVETLKTARYELRIGQAYPRDALIERLVRMGFIRSEQVMEPGDFAIRGDIIDLYVPGLNHPVRLDFFGDDLETIRRFDAETQRSVGAAQQVTLLPVAEAGLDPDSVARFRSGYRELFGVVSDGDDPLYEAISKGMRYNGMEHWLALFHDGLDTLFAYLPDARVTLDHQTGEAVEARLEMICDYYQARKDITGGGFANAAVYNPVPPERLYLDQAEWQRLLAPRPVGMFSPYTQAEAVHILDLGGKAARNFGDLRARPGVNVLYDGLKDHIRREQQSGRRVLITAFSEGARDRLVSVMREHGIAGITPVACWSEALEYPDEKQIGIAVLGLEHGFTGTTHCILSEQDILGERLRRRVSKRKADTFLREAGEISEGDLVVHIEHGIGRYEGLRTVTAGGAPHDCLEIAYEGGDKLFVPVENIEVLSRYGSSETGAVLDRLGGANWQARKAKLKQRIRDMAEKLIKIAARRHLRPGDVLQMPPGVYDEFCAGFPYSETDDQARAIKDTLDDLTTGKPMDRLVCGDVGFGKTEVALRAALAAVMAGKQVAVVVPTTLLARQHFRTFQDRFKNLPVIIEQVSRMVPAPQAAKIKQAAAAGSVDIVIGTHALLARTVSFKNLGLLIIDEEQHFGVRHKERLKELKSDVHVLTLTATPIPRTLQMALTGVKELSVIATPPVDRLAVRTFITPYDPVVVREALLREQYRGGQSFYVCPRVADLAKVAQALETLVPEIRFAVAHGQMAAKDLDIVMSAFYERKFDMLLATNIIESGIDVPSANTMIVYRSDMFGLAQLYQLRGRIGRSKIRAYCHLTLAPGKVLTRGAERRLQVMQTLDTLGAGFNLASHDLDIRGAGNLLGEEQSGHIKEVGIELYQNMLEEAVAQAKGEVLADGLSDWAPQINIGMPVLIPERYVPDLGVRLTLYRRIAALQDRSEIDGFAAEMADRFGKLPSEAENLLTIVEIKQMCRIANVEKVDAGPKGATLSLRDNIFPNPPGLIGFIQQTIGTAKMRPDHKIVFMRPWDGPMDRLEGVSKLMRKLAEIAENQSPKNSI